MDIKNNFMVFHFDDIIIFSKRFDDHITHLNEEYSRLRKTELTIEPEKTLFKQSVFLGFLD